MSVWKTGRRPDFMDRQFGVLTSEEIAHAVASLSFEGLQRAAALGFVYAGRTGSNPAYIDETLYVMATESNEKSVQEKIAQ